MSGDKRVEKILAFMQDVENSPLSINRYFKDHKSPFSHAQYYRYKQTMKEKGVSGLYDYRGGGHYIKFTSEMKHFVKGILRNDQNISTSTILRAIKSEFEVGLSTTVINDFRRENNLSWVRPKTDPPLSVSGAGEIAIALALEAGIITTLTDTIYGFVHEKQTSEQFKKSQFIKKDHTSLRSKGRFTAAYNDSPKVRASRFRSLDEKLKSKRFAAMNIFSLSRECIRRYILALFSLPIVTNNGKVRGVNSPRGSALQYLCGFDYKASALDKFLRDLKYLKVSDGLLEATAQFWINFWSSKRGQDTLFACYYIDGNTKALWSSKPCHKGKVTMLGRVMNCLEQVFIHDGQGHPLYFRTFNGHADLGKHALQMMDKVTDYLNDCTTVAQCSVNRILIMDAAGNGVKTLRELKGYYYITILDSNQVTERKIKSISEEKRYEHGDACLIECSIELKDSNEKDYIFETRAVQVKWDNGRESVLITNLPRDLFSTDNVVKSYFDRWPLEELNFKDMKKGVNLHRVVGYGKKVVRNAKAIEKSKKLKKQIDGLTKRLKGPLIEMQNLEKQLQTKIEEERVYREKSEINEGRRVFVNEADALQFKLIQKEINKLTRKIKKIEKQDEKPFRALKKKQKELARIIDKKKIYKVDVELDQLMTCFKLSFVNICSYLLEECFNGEKMTLGNLLENIFDLCGKVQCHEDQRHVFIQQNSKQKQIMGKLENALTIINAMEIKDTMKRTYKFDIVSI